MSKDFLETVRAAGGIALEEFDVAVGPANTGIIDILLSAGNGVLTDEAPGVLRSTGALGAARTLDISALEDAGRVFHLHVENSDITTFSLTVNVSTTINGAASLVIAEASDWIVVHQVGGVWKAFRQGTQPGAALARVDFVAADWAAGTPNQITILQTGAPAAGQKGPHGLAIASTYVVQVYNTTVAGTPRQIDLRVQVDAGSGDITLFKAPAAANFNGTADIVGTS